MSGFTIVLKKSIGSGCNVISISGGGSVILKSMTINGGSSRYGTNNTPLLDIGIGSISCEDVTFENITRVSGNGTIFEFPSLSTSITFSGITFGNCKCLDGSGGAISVTLSSSLYSLSFISLSFTSCYASVYGGGIYLSLSSLPSSLSISLTNFTSNAATKGNTLFV